METPIKWESGNFNKHGDLLINWICPNCLKYNNSIYLFDYQILNPTNRTVTCSFGCKHEFTIQDTPEN